MSGDWQSWEEEGLGEAESKGRMLRGGKELEWFLREGEGRVVTWRGGSLRSPEIPWDGMG